MDRRILQLLVCPISKQQLLPATEEQHQKIAEQDNYDFLANTIVTYLITENQLWAYPVVDGVPWLMESHRIRLG